MITEHEGLPTVPDVAPYDGRTDLQVAIDRERNRRIAQELVAAERAPKVAERHGFTKVADLVAQAVTEIKLRHEHGLDGFRTGITEFDERGAPMMQPGKLVVVAAGTKVGKTSLLWQLAATYAAQGLPVAVLSYEDDPSDAVLRAIANVGSGDIGQLRSGFRRDGKACAIPEEFDRAAATVASLDIQVMTTPSTCAQIGKSVGAWRATWAPGQSAGVVIIDQLSHIVPDDPAEFRRRFPGYAPPPAADNEVKLLEWQAGVLQRIARQWNVLVLLAHQLNEQAKEHEEPTERSLRGSRGIGHKVDGLVIPWRPARLPNPHRGMPGEPETVENATGRMWLCVPIARGCAGRFKVEVQWQGIHQRVADLDAKLGEEWAQPDPITEERRFGMAALTAVRTRWETYLADVDVAAATGDEPPAPPTSLTTLATPGARWTLPAKPVVVPPASGASLSQGLGGGGRAALGASPFVDLF